MQHLIVALIVLVAVAFSVWKLMPARHRLRALVAIDAWAARHPRLAGWRERSLGPRILRAGGTGCAGCAAHTQRRPQPRPR
jgi:hypothetical protein